KAQLGLGNYWRVCHELLLLGVRGSCPFADKSLRSVARLPRGRHSGKPEPARRMIEEVSPGPYPELFGRSAGPGWAVWGDEVKGDLFTAALESPLTCARRGPEG